MDERKKNFEPQRKEDSKTEPDFEFFSNPRRRRRRWVPAVGRVRGGGSYKLISVAFVSAGQVVGG